MAVAGTVGVTSEVASDTLLFSTDGRSWRQVEGSPLANANGLAGQFTEAGYYLAAAKGEPRAAASGTGAPVALFVVAAVVPLILGYLLLGRRRHSQEGPSAARDKAS